MLAPPFRFLFFLVVFTGRRIGFAIFGPELVAGAMDENIFQSGLADRDCLNLAREGFDKVGDKTVATFALDADLRAEDNGFDVETRTNMFR
jgi:hypothetical protein